MTSCIKRSKSNSGIQGTEDTLCLKAGEKRAYVGKKIVRSVLNSVLPAEIAAPE